VAYLRARPECIWEGGADELGKTKHTHAKHAHAHTHTTIISLEASRTAMGLDVRR
jgi:hypothetical protein